MKTDATLVRTAIALRRDQMEKLQALSSLTGAPVAELIRRGVDSYLEMRKAELKGGTK
jgi:predicted DNA-binding protein